MTQDGKVQHHQYYNSHNRRIQLFEVFCFFGDCGAAKTYYFFECIKPVKTCRNLKEFTKYYVLQNVAS